MGGTAPNGTPSIPNSVKIAKLFKWGDTPLQQQGNLTSLLFSYRKESMLLISLICNLFRNTVSNLRAMNDWMTVNNELQRIWKEKAAA
jgi:hypothetical protein